MSSSLIETLLFKSEGADLDFKSEQYRFTKASDKDKGGLLKDILAMANAWREGTAYILVGCKEDRPNPAVVVGISESLDDADLQQFVNGKVEPRLDFRYEEHVCHGRRVGVFVIPKQPRPFWATSALGSVRPCAVYVRRGSSTGEATPPEILRMYEVDSGRKPASVAVALLSEDGSAVPNLLVARFLSFGKEDDLPDCVPRAPEGSFDLLSSFERVNRNYWRELAEYLRVRAGAVHIAVQITNRSDFPLTDCKIEVTVEGLHGQTLQALTASELPDRPSSDGLYEFRGIRGLSDVLADQAAGLKVAHKDGVATYEARFKSVLPAESVVVHDPLIVVPSKAGRLRARWRLLAAELAEPVSGEQEVDIVGDARTVTLDELTRMDEQS